MSRAEGPQVFNIAYAHQLNNSAEVGSSALKSSKNIKSTVGSSLAAQRLNRLQENSVHVYQQYNYGTDSNTSVDLSNQ